MRELVLVWLGGAIFGAVCMAALYGLRHVVERRRHHSAYLSPRRVEKGRGKDT